MLFILLTTLLAIILIPQGLVFGIPVKLEDLIIYSFLLFFLYNNNYKIRLDNSVKKSILLFLVFILINYLSLSIQIFNGYDSSLRDFNTIFLYFKSLIYFISGYLMHQYKDSVRLNTAIIIFLIPLIGSSIISVVQFYDLGGLKELAFNIYRDGEYTRTRAIGSIGNPNLAAYFQGLALIMIIAYKANTTVRLITKVLISILIIISIFVTYSRTAIIALTVSLIFFMVISRKFTTLILTGASAALALSIYYEQLILGTRFGTFFDDDTEGSKLNIDSRSEGIWSYRLDQFYSNPFLGSGPGKNLDLGHSFSSATYDNSFLLLLITSGILGLFTYLLFFLKFTSFKYIFNKNLEQESQRSRILMSTICIFTLIFFITADLVWNIRFSSYFYLFLGFYVYYTRLLNDKIS